MSSTDPLIGKKLGDYIIVDILGQGGMARVYRGLDKKLNRYAAVKVIDAHMVNDDQEEYRQRFQNEARAIARLNHPNIVGIYQFDQVGTLYYMAMSFIEGKDLRSIIKNHSKGGTRMTYDEVLRVIRDIGEALDYAHSESVIHRDVKPSNIMVTPNGRAVLTDFGLALSIPEGTIGNTFGSAHYIAPEQAVSSAQVVPQSDIYALGVVLFEMLTNRVPFNDPSAMSVAMKHLTDIPPLPSQVNPNISPQIDQVVMRALEKDAQKRFASGKEMTRALENAFAASNESAQSPAYSSDIEQPEISTAPRRAEDSTNLSNIRRDWVQRPPLPNILEDAPTITDSKASAATRSQVLKQQERQVSRRLWIIGGAAILAVVIVVAALVVLMSNGGSTDANVTASANAVLAAQTGTAERVQQIALQQTETQTALLVPSATVTTSPTLAPTEAASSTPISTTASTDAVQPTEPPAATDVPVEITPISEESDTPAPTDPVEVPTTVAPSATIAPTTAVPTPTGIFTSTTVAPTATLTPTPAGDAPVLLRYDNRSLTLLNHSAKNVDVSDLTFVQTKADGTKLDFSTQRWEGGSRPTTALPAGDCFQVGRDDIAIVDKPDYCGKRHAWSRASFLHWFWISDDPAATFEIRRGNQLLATCSIAAGECTFDPQR